MHHIIRIKGKAIGYHKRCRKTFNKNLTSLQRNPHKIIRNNKHGVKQGFRLEINIRKSTIFFYTGNEYSKSEIKKTIHVIATSKD